MNGLTGVGGNVFTVTVDNSYTLYLDGKEVSDLTNYNDWQYTDYIQLNDTILVGIEGINFSDGPAGILAFDSSGRLWTNSSWRCSNVSVDGWMNVGFDDSGWPYAKAEAQNGQGDWGTVFSGSAQDINLNAFWIWTNNFNANGNPVDSTVYCRMPIGKLTSD